MDYIAAHLAESLIIIGLILLAIEVLVLGFTTFFVFFIGVGTIATGTLMLWGIVPATWVNALWLTALLTGIVALLSWRPLQRMQQQHGSKTVDNDMIGHRFVLSAPLNSDTQVMHRYSGIDWQVKSTQSLPAGTEVRIVSMQVGILIVESVSQ